jgi:hypothetical protein
MIDIEEVIKEVSKRTEVDKDIVSQICKHVFKCTVDEMKSENTQDILFNDLFKFKLKRRYKENKNEKYKSK